ncbi:polysaccharide biosynthesis tyrosine autokinase [Opitutales bacterium]|nr:polysaccharide biosynthesis tyrosine autokinase [Opitutales bacterium]
MEEEFDNVDSPKLKSSKSRAKGISEFLLVIRDRWLLAVALALPVSLGYVYVKFQDTEFFQSSSSFRLIPPPAVLNLQKVDRDTQVQGLVVKHREGLNSQELRANVVQKISGNPESKSIMLAPYLRDGIPVGIESTIAYSISVSPPSEGRPRFTISTTSRSAKGAMLVADIVQSEYEKLHKSRKSQQVESVRNLLENLLEQSIQKESDISNEMSSYKKKLGLPFIEDEKKDTAVRKSQYSSEVTSSKLAQIKIDSLLRQVLQIQARIGTRNNSSRSADIDNDIAVIKDFFEIDAIESFGSVPSLRKSLYDLERTRKRYEESSTGYLERHPKMMENARQVQEVKKSLILEVTSAIEDMKDKRIQLIAQEQEFQSAMSKVQQDSMRLSDIEEWLVNKDRELAVVRTSTDQIQRRLNDVRIEQALPSEQEEPLHKEQFAFLPGGPFTPNKAAIRNTGLYVFIGLFFAIPICLEFVDNRVKSPFDVEVFIGKDLIGGIPKISEVEELQRPLIVGNDLDDGLTESFRSMYSRIQMNSHTDYPKSILITSAIPSEGKSLISANLAYSCANHGRKTVLVDFDLRRPGLHKFNNLNNEKGLVTLVNEALINPSNLKQAVLDTVHEIHPNLFLLPSGGKTRAATEMLEQKEFDLVHNELRKEFDVIIVDSPPIGLFPDSLAIARKVDEVLFVTRYGKVSRKIAKSLVENLEETGVNVLGVVLNDLPQKKTPGYYYSGYYGYGYFRYKYYNKYYGKDKS